MTHDAEREALLESAYDAAWEAVGRNATTTDAVMLRVRQKLSVEEIRRFMGTVVPAVLRARAASVPAQEPVAWRDALEDCHGALVYIRSVHGDLYGVGWDRCMDKAAKVLAAPPADTARNDRIMELQALLAECWHAWNGSGPAIDLDRIKAGAGTAALELEVRKG